MLTGGEALWIRYTCREGATKKEGGSHIKVYKDGVNVSALSRQREIAETAGRLIEKQTGVKL